MSNTAAISTLVTKTALAMLVNNLVFAKNANRDYEEQFGTDLGGRYQSGDTIYIKKPPRYTVRAGKVAVPQATTVNKIPLTIAQAGCDAKFSSFDLTLNFDVTQMKSLLAPAIEVIANKIDADGLLLAANTSPNFVPIAGAPTPTSQQALTSMLQVNQKLTENGAPKSDRSLVVSPLGTVELMPGLQGYFNSQSTLGEQYDKGRLISSLGFAAIGEDQNVPTITNGTQAVGTATVNGASQTGSTLTVSALSGTVVAGQKFTLAGVNAVNPVSRQTTGSLQQFTVTANAASGATSLSISPAITPTGAFQNVTASPGASAAITFVSPTNGAGGFQANVGYHKDAFTLACVPMFTPTSGRGVVAAAIEEYKGFRLRMIQFYDGVNDDLITRFDVLYGWAATYPELSCILGG